MSLSELQDKDVVNVRDGRVLGKVMDITFCAQDGRVQAIVVPAHTGLLQLLRGEKNGMVIPWQRIECIGDDVILVCLDEQCRCE